ncbi:hypothetical protein ANAEL_01275 [Anaerolineales bacterium]|nr:hypothetical protein ANAEL_01275 [Anaerolineales bacterium]
MKSLWKSILDGLTYKDLAGKRQPRVYTIITGLILLLLLTAGGMAGLNRYLLMSRVLSTPVPVSITAQATETLENEVPATIQPEDGSAIECPTDPADWSLTPTYASKNYNVIQPACVYQGLERTIAWALAIREGYSRAEATRQLGFTAMPMRQVKTVTIPANAKGLADVPVSFIPPNPHLTEWRLDANGEAAVTYALRGCFRTSTVVGNRVEIWGGEYPVICLVVEDAENTHIIYSLNGHTYTSTAKPTRSFLLFGYLPDGDGNWVWLGTQNDPKLEITDPQANANERLSIATMYDSHPWDAKWLMDAHHLVMQPPPENWRSMTDENEKQAILNGISTGQNGAAP